jgi:hypothetical protein
MEYPIELEQNVLEWVNDLPLSEISCHGESINGVLKHMQWSNDCIPLVLNNFVLYKKGNYKNNVILYRGF